MQLSKVLLSQVHSCPLTIPSDCTHIFLLDGFWDTIEPERDTDFLLSAEGNTSVRGTIVEEAVWCLPNVDFFFGEARLLRESNFFDAFAPLMSGEWGAFFLSRPFGMYGFG